MYRGSLHPGACSWQRRTLRLVVRPIWIGLVLIIFALGLYHLFIDPELILPEWLETTSFETLKGHLLIVIIVVLAVMFLGYAATTTDATMIAGPGTGIS